VLAFGFAQTLLGLSQQAGEFFNLSRSLFRSSPSQFGPLVGEKPLSRGYPVGQGSNALAVVILEGESGDSQCDDAHQDNCLWCSPDHSRIRYDTIGYSCKNAVLHF